MKKTSLLKLRNITKIFKVRSEDVVVLKNINLEINEGDLRVIFGPSGCGKSTLLNVILGLEEPTNGSVNFAGKDIYLLTEDERSDIRKRNFGMIYQQQNWIRALTVLENVAFPLSLLGVEKQKALTRARQELSQVGMSDWANYIPTELSAGQQQKVSLARALICDPKLLIADEPTGNMDFQSGIELMELLRKLNQMGKTIILVTHDLTNLDYSKTITQMLDGQIVREFVMNRDKLKLMKKDLVKIKKGKRIVNPKKSTNNSDINVRDNEKAAKAAGEFKAVSVKQLLLLFVSNFVKIFRFMGLLLVYFVNRLFYLLLKSKLLPFSIGQRILPPLSKIYQNLYGFLEKGKKEDIKSIDLISISISNLMVRKVRTFITIGGMALGIAVIVFLVSIGYGLEELVILRVASLKEMKQIDAIPAVESNIEITDKTLAALRAITGVENILPVISVAGKVDYKNSVTDVVVYGVQSDYLKESSISPIEGNIFENNELDDQDQKTSDEGSEEAREAVVNKAFLDVLGVSGTGVKERFEVVFVPTEEVSKELDRDLEKSIEYQVIGVIEGVQSPVIYVPIYDLQEIGIDNYSEVKVVVVSQGLVEETRKKVEVMGLKTTSVIDTVSQIEGMFSTFRFFLWIIGLFTLMVASLGMVNTLTISLLERVREVGFMKALGMKSTEVQELFLTESITMGVFGGIFGLIVGMVTGKLLSLGLSSIAISRGFGLIDITSTPLFFVCIIIFVSVSIGVLTGIYPAQRSEQVSPLDALRYE